MKKKMTKEYKDFIRKMRDEPLVYLIYSFDGLEVMTLKFSPDFFIRKVFPESRKLERNEKEYGKFIVEKIIPMINSFVFIQFNRKTKTVETTILKNPVFDKCVFFDSLDSERLNEMAEVLDEYEMEIGEELEDTVTLELLVAGYLAPKIDK